MSREKLLSLSAKDFIEEDVEHLEDNLKKYKRELEEKEREKKRIKKQKEITKCHEIALKVNQLIDSDIDFTKHGWVSEASKIIGITSQKTRKWIEKNYPKLLKNCYKRNVIMGL